MCCRLQTFPVNVSLSIGIHTICERSTSALEYITRDNLIFFIEAHGFSVLALILSEHRKQESDEGWRGGRRRERKEYVEKEKKEHTNKN